MYWQFNHQSSPQIETVLAKKDITLSEVLEQENILQELKNPNTKLIEFITRSDILNELITLIIEEPSEELDEQERYRRSNLACEVLTTDIPRLNESLSDISLLTKLYSFLEKDPPLNPLLASFFSSTLSLLICRKADQYWYSYQFTCLNVLDFLKSREDSLKLLLKHLGTSAIMDLTLKLITQVEGEAMQQNLADWLESEELIKSIIELFHPKIEPDRQHNAAQLLCDAIRKFREKEWSTKVNSKPDPILEALESPEMIQKLLRQILEADELCESSIVSGISVLLTLLEPPISDSPARRNPYTNDDSTVGSIDTSKVIIHPVLSSIALAIVPFLPKLHDLLINPPKKPPVRLACGVIDPPLGNTRLTVIMLVAALLFTRTPEVNEKLDELNTVQVLLDLFFQYTWNNFLHTQVDKCLTYALNSSVTDSKEPNLLIHNIFIKCCLLQRILEAWEENDSEQGKGGNRKGYMGHLINIANSIWRLTFGDLGNFLKDNIEPDTMAKWEYYVETVLMPINNVHSRFLGGSHPSQCISKDDSEYNVPFDAQSNNGLMSAASHNWKNVVDNFTGLLTMADKEERDEETSLREEQERRIMFERLCFNRREPSEMEGSNDDEDVWESETLKRKSADLDVTIEDEEVWEDLPTSVWSNEEARNSSEGEDEKLDNYEKLESIWSAPVVQSDPWGTCDSDKNESNNDGWANFDSVEFTPSVITTNSPVVTSVEADPSKPEEVQVEESEKAAGDSCKEAHLVPVEKEVHPIPVDTEDLHNNIDASAEVAEKEIHQESDLDEADETPPMEWNKRDETGDMQSLESKSDNNANLKSLTEEPSQNEELYLRICSTKNKVNEKVDDVPKTIENTPIVNKSKDSSPQPLEEEGSAKTTSLPSDPV